MKVIVNRFRFPIIHLFFYFFGKDVAKYLQSLIEIRKDEVEEEEASSMNMDQEGSSGNEQRDVAINDKQTSEFTSSTNIISKEYINIKKEQLAEIAQLIIADPEKNVIF